MGKNKIREGQCFLHHWLSLSHLAALSNAIAGSKVRISGSNGPQYSVKTFGIIQVKRITD
jgi:hypothetical protein